MGFDGGDSEDIGGISPGDLVKMASAADVVSSETKAQFNSMYKFKIDERWQNT